MRLRVYQELGKSDVWVSVVEAKTEADKIKYALSDNDRAGQYVEQDLAELLEANKLEINLEDYKIDLGKPIDLQTLLDRFGPEVEEDEVPEVPEKAISKVGEVYQLGRHRLMCGDATKIEDVEKLMDGRKADMVFTDPPYGMDLDTDWTDMVGSKGMKIDFKNLQGGGNYSKVIGDEKQFNFKDFEWLDCKEQFWWGGDYYAKSLPEGGSWLVWDKREGERDTDKMIGSGFELCWSKQKHKREIVRKLWAGFFGLGSQDTKLRIHPTQKPIEVCSWFIKRFSKQDDIVLDLFGGSGSTLIAAEQTNRTCYMMEIDPKYCDVIRTRYDNFIKNRSETGDKNA